MGMTRPNGGGCAINAETGVRGDGGEAIPSQRHAAHDKEGTYSGESHSQWLARDKAMQLYLTQLGVLWCIRGLFREGTPCPRAHL